MNNIGNVFQAISNPQAFIQNAMNNSQLMQNPMMQNAIGMYRSGNVQGLENLANNIAKQKGISIDDIRKQLGI